MSEILPQIALVLGYIILSWVIVVGIEFLLDIAMCLGSEDE